MVACEAIPGGPTWSSPATNSGVCELDLGSGRVCWVGGGGGGGGG